MVVRATAYQVLGEQLFKFGSKVNQEFVSAAKAVGIVVKLHPDDIEENHCRGNACIYKFFYVVFSADTAILQIRESCQGIEETVRMIVDAHENGTLSSPRNSGGINN